MTCVCSIISSGLTIIEIVTTMTSISASDGSITPIAHRQREQHEAEFARLRQRERHAACALGANGR